MRGSSYGLLGEKCFSDGTCQGGLECNLTSNECKFPDKPDNYGNIKDSENTDDSTMCNSSNCSGCCAIETSGTVKIIFQHFSKQKVI